jgi:membrane associated rhomboid family serine protease
LDNPSPPPTTPAPPPPAWEPDEPQGPGLLEMIREAKVTWAFVASAVIIYLLCWNETGRQLMLWIPEATASKYGAYSWARVREHGEWWRVFSTLFVSRHGLDALIYLVMFAQLGPKLEKVLGSARFGVLYLLTGAGGVALAEVFDPGARFMAGGFAVGGDTIVVVYGAMGAIPGLILGMTGSLWKTVRNSEARWSLFYVLFWTFIRYQMTHQFELAILCSLGLGMVLGATLALSRRRLQLGLASSVVPALVSCVAIGLVATGMRWQDGKLVDRGRPASGRVPPGQTTEQPEPVEAEPKRSYLDPPETSNEQVQALREKTTPFLERFGPLPKQMGYTLDEQEEARQLLAQVERVANGTNLVLGELDPERIRLNIICSNWNAAARIARELIGLDRQPYARALAGLTALYQPNLEAAEDHFSAVIGDEQFLVEAPEALYYYAVALDERHGPVVAAAHFERYLRLVADGPHPAWRPELIQKARGKLGR